MRGRFLASGRLAQSQGPTTCRVAAPSSAQSEGGSSPAADWSSLPTHPEAVPHLPSRGLVPEIDLPWRAPVQPSEETTKVSALIRLEQQVVVTIEDNPRTMLHVGFGEELPELAPERRFGARTGKHRGVVQCGSRDHVPCPVEIVVRRMMVCHEPLSSTGFSLQPKRGSRLRNPHASRASTTKGRPSGSRSNASPGMKPAFSHTRRARRLNRATVTRNAAGSNVLRANSQTARA
jgi:hypothetical protein